MNANVRRNVGNALLSLTLTAAVVGIPTWFVAYEIADRRADQKQEQQRQRQKDAEREAQMRAPVVCVVRGPGPYGRHEEDNTLVSCDGYRLIFRDGAFYRAQ